MNLTLLRMEDFPLFRNFTLLMMLPLTLWGFFNGSSLEIGVGFLCAFSMFMFIRMAKDNYLWYWESMANNEKMQSDTHTMETVFKGVHDNADLLNQTSGSAGEISRQVKEIQEATQRSAEEMDTISGIVQEANTRVEGIASAVEEQSGATNEVAKNINEASSGFYSANQMMGENDEGLKQVAHDISQLEETAKGVEAGAARVDQNAAILLTLAREMVSMADVQA